MNKVFLGIAIVLILLIGFYLISNSGGITGDTVIDTNEDSKVKKTFILTGENFKFLLGGKEAPELHVKEGDLVRIEFSSTNGFHDWVIGEFNAATERVQTDGSTYVEFTADKKGTFEYYCSVGKHRENGMKGNLIVE
tara:strand:+ start:124 stop:534 length:411 start_codon:yes stop_codon:yes gene_type:complete